VDERVLNGRHRPAQDRFAEVVAAFTLAAWALAFAAKGE
jgi:hypothetical protein